MAIDLKKLTEKFFTDPDWAMMEELIEEHIKPVRSTTSIVTKDKSNDEIATEVRGRQLMIESLDRFLSDTGIISRRKVGNNQTNYK